MVRIYVQPGLFDRIEDLADELDVETDDIIEALMNLFKQEHSTEELKDYLPVYRKEEPNA